MRGREGALKASDKIGGYILERQIGRGVSASTWLARPDKPSAAAPFAVLKILDLSEASTWSGVDVFKRESEALKSLSHPSIPAYFDSFESEEEGRLRLVLAMEYIEGEDLDKIAASGRKCTDIEVERVLAGLSDILAYLGSLRPPIVHRDVNPRNIIMRADGSIALVDFSGVQDAVRTALFPGATLVGTAGYIPIEQVAGKASHRSDLYGAAATAVFLLTGRNPAELPTRNLKIDLTGIVDVSPRLQTVLDSWLEPDVADRALQAAEAASILRGETALPAGNSRSRPVQAAGVRRDPYQESLPMESKILIERSEEGVAIKLPRLGMRSGSVRGAPFSVFWIGFIAFWTFMALRMRAPIFFPLFSIPFWGIGFFMAKSVLGPLLSRRDIVLGPKGLLVRTETLGFEQSAAWPLEEIGAVRVVTSRMGINPVSAKALLIETSTKQLLLGAGLSERELKYLEKYLQEELARLRGR